MTSQLAVTQIDYSAEKTTSRFYLADVAVDGSNWGAITTARDNILTAIGAVTFNNVAEHVISSPVRLTNASASDENAQRERKLLVAYQDNTTLKQYTVSVGLADVSKFVITPNTDLVDLTTGGGLSLKSGLDGNALSEAGNAITVLQVRMVGRNT